jgi:hypothetical protein
MLTGVPENLYMVLPGLPKLLGHIILSLEGCLQNFRLSYENNNQSSPKIVECGDSSDSITESFTFVTGTQVNGA